jgi:lipopolysaccharide/colanic/teichoic acid biosynthesis glycosyltransferase
LRFRSSGPTSIFPSFSLAVQTLSSGFVSSYRGKRVFDLALAIATAPLWAPIVGALALVVRARMGAPAFFVQTRPGLHGVPFRLIKLRTMSNARDADGRPLPDEARLTRLGKFLRSTSLDELPELWNVLRGDMSLVGPRPLLTKYLPLYSDGHRRRHDVRPGITGLAQVGGRNAITWPERLDLDVEYVDRCSFALDMRILWRSARAVLRREGISAEGQATMPEFTGYDRA